ncbi:MAG TPA: hypothetical protein PK224_21430 [Nitrospira sp.]|nr:hypothetical protein [Nitrospira sp.]
MAQRLMEPLTVMESFDVLRDGDLGLGLTLDEEKGSGVFIGASFCGSGTRSFEFWTGNLVIHTIRLPESLVKQ